MTEESPEFSIDQLRELRKKFGTSERTETRSPRGDEPMQMPSIASAAESLLYLARRLGNPLIMAMSPPDNDYNLKPGDVQGSKSSELRPSCDSLVVAVVGSPEEMQELVDLVQKWQEKKEAR